MDNQYDMNYHSVDEQYNDLMEMSREFDRRYDFVWSGKKQLGPNQWRFSLRDKQGNSISSAEVRLLVTREATTKQDIDLGALPYVDSYYIAELDVPAAGTWLLNMNLLVKDLRVNRQFIMDLPATTAQKTDAEKLINARKRIEALESKN
jgi:nitrogen fixation protein FixH